MENMEEQVDEIGSAAYHMMFDSRWNRTSTESHICRVILALHDGTLYQQVAEDKTEKRYVETFRKIVESANGILPIDANSGRWLTPVVDAVRFTGGHSFSLSNYRLFLAKDRLDLLQRFHTSSDKVVALHIIYGGYTVLETAGAKHNNWQPTFFPVSVDSNYAFGSFEDALIYTLCPVYADAITALVAAGRESK